MGHTISRIVESDESRANLVLLIQNKKAPFTAAIKDGKHRTNPQNRLQHLWYSEAAEQLGDYSADEYKARCKLRHGVPILLASDGKFADMWEATAAHLSHEMQVELMYFMQVTSLMNRKEKKQYLDAVQKFLLERGVRLTDPEDLK